MASYNEEFKKRIVCMHLEEGRTIKSLSEEYHVSENGIGYWLKKYREECLKDPAAKEEYDLMKENLKLRKELEEMRTEDVMLDDLIGYEIQKKKIVDNTEAFVEGRKANNALLFGDSGTGKSTTIKAIINEYYDRGLRMIEIYKHQFQDLSQVISLIKNRNYRFIIYMDDLSFEEFEIEYKYLKAVIEGGLEIRPDNVLIYATSNRRHLIKETWNDRNDMENNNGIHRSDTIQEKLSLVNRFGVTISYSAPSQKEYFEIVKGLAEKEHITMDEKELCAEANKWELAHGGISGRTAQQVKAR